jgi:hypothetical protein
LLAAGDTFKLSTWGGTEDGNGLKSTTPIFITDQNALTVTCDANAGNEISYISIPAEGTGHTTELAINSTTYPFLYYRWKTSDSSVKANITLEFHGGTTQEIVANGSSTSWTDGVGTITAGKTIDHIRLGCNDAVGTVYYDFVLICGAVFTFPQYSKVSYSGVSKSPTLQISGRATDITQNLGSGNLKIEITGDIDHELGTWKRTGDTNAGDVFLDLLHNAKTEPFQWFVCDRGEFKVSVDAIDFTESADQKYLYDYIIRLQEYSRGTKNNDTYSERFGL